MIRPENIARPIVIVGSPRTGTSLTAGLLASQGVFTGNCRPADRKNPRGFFENKALHQHRGDEPADPAAVARTLSSQDYRGGPWLVKHGPGGWRAWLSLAALFVLPRRDLEPTIASQLKWQPPGKTAEQRRGIVAKQQRQLDQIRDEFGGIDFWPQELMTRDWSPFVLLCHKLGLGPVDFDAAEAFLEPSLWDREV